MVIQFFFFFDNITPHFILNGHSPFHSLEAIIARIDMAWEMGVKSQEVKSDSQVVVGHIKGEYEAQGKKTKQYLAKVKEIMEVFDKIVFTKVPWEENVKANTLACIGSFANEEIATTGHPVQDLTEPSITRMI